MARTVTRDELYRLLWSEPMKNLAKTFEISDVGLSKACDRLAVPVPPRGYWARKTANKPVIQTPLPPRPPGLNDQTIVGGRRNYWENAYYSQPSNEELLGPLPDPPVFEEPMEAVRARVEAVNRR